MFIEDMDYTVAHVLRKMGDSFMWCYDLVSNPHPLKG